MSYRPEIVETLASAVADLEGYIDPANPPDGYSDDALFLLSKLEHAGFEVVPCRSVVLPDRTITISSGVDHPQQRRGKP